MSHTDSPKFEIIDKIGTVSEEGKWHLELNRIIWHDREPKYDLRRWSADHKYMGKGITLSEKDILRLYEILSEEIKFLNDAK